METNFLTDLLKEHVADEDKLKEIVKAVHAENGKDIKVVQDKLETAEADKQHIQDKLDMTNETLEKFKDIDVEELQKENSTLKETIDQKEKEFKAEREKETYNRAVNDFFGALPKSFEFASELSKEAAVSKFKEAELKLQEGKFLGAEDFLKGLKEKDPTAFKSTEPLDNKVSVAPTGGNGTGTPDSRTSNLMAAMGLTEEKEK